MATEVRVGDGTGEVGGVSEPKGRVALVGGLISALITGGVAALLSYPKTCDTTFAPFMSDCRNVVGWTSFADYPSVAIVISVVAAVLAGVLVFSMVRFGDN